MWSALWKCISAAFVRNFPDLSWWLLAVLIACIIAGAVGGIASSGALLPVIIAGCAAVAGISIVGATLVAIASAIWDCS